MISPNPISSISCKSCIVLTARKEKSILPNEWSDGRVCLKPVTRDQFQNIIKKVYSWQTHNCVYTYNWCWCSTGFKAKRRNALFQIKISSQISIVVNCKMSIRLKLITAQAAAIKTLSLLECVKIANIAFLQKNLLNNDNSIL